MTEFNDEDISESLGKFEAAMSARHVDIPAVTIGRVLVAIDQSNQDANVIALASELAKKTRADIFLTYAYPGETDSAKDRYLAEQVKRLTDAGIGAAHGRSGEGKSFEQISVLAEEGRYDLAVLAAPYLEDFQELGTASVGTNLDMLMSRRTMPLLVVRQPLENVAQCLDRIVVPLRFLTDEDDASPLGWAMKLVAEGGLIQLLAVADAEAIEEMRGVAGQSFDADELDEGRIAGLTRPEAAGLVAAAQRHAEHAGIRCRVSVRVGPVIDATMQFLHETPSILAATCPHQCSATGYQRLLAMLRESRFPVLIV